MATARPERATAEGLLLAGNSPATVAKMLDLPLGTVKGWKRLLGQSGVVPAAVDTVPEKELKSLGELLMRNLQAGLESTEQLKRRVFDEAWFKRQDAASVAKLIDVIESKNIRLIEAMERAAGTLNRGESDTDSL